MYPYLLKEPFEISSYFTMVIVGFIVGILIATKEAKRVGVDPVKIIDLTLVIFLASMIGAKFFHVLFDGHLQDYINMCKNPLIVDINAKYLSGGCTTDAMCSAAELGNICNLENGKCYTQSCTAAFEIWRGGFVYYGGMIFAILSSIIFIKIKKMSVAKVADILAPPVILGLGIGRIGCLLAGCCYGAVTDSFLGIHFPGGSSAHHAHLDKFPNLHLTESLAVIPTQPISTIVTFSIFAYLVFYLRKRQKYQGQLFMHMLFGYSVFRFIIEIFRDDERGAAFALSTSQWISIVIFGITTIITLIIRKTNKFDKTPKENLTEKIIE